MKNLEQTRRTAAFKTALKTMDQGPKRIREARNQCDSTIQYIKDHSNEYSQNSQDALCAEATARRDKAIRSEVDAMRNALEIIKEDREFDGAGVDVTNPKLQGALNLINAMRGELSPADQLSIAESFRGDIGSLRYLAQLYKRDGLYFADKVQEMTNPVPHDAIVNAQYALDYFDLYGEWNTDCDQKIYWTKGEFAKASERYGFGDTATDPYEDALAQVKKMYADNPDVQSIAAHAIMDIRGGGLSPSAKDEVFNKTVQQIQDATNKTQTTQLRWENAQYEAKQHNLI